MIQLHRTPVLWPWPWLDKVKINWWVIRVLWSLYLCITNLACQVYMNLSTGCCCCNRVELVPPGDQACNPLIMKPGFYQCGRRPGSVGRGVITLFFQTHTWYFHIFPSQLSACSRAPFNPFTPGTVGLYIGFKQVSDQIKCHWNPQEIWSKDVQLIKELHFSNDNVL